MISYGSVCSGIEAASVAWHGLGFRASWFAEIEPFPSAVLAHRWPAVKNLGDMTRISSKVLAGMIDAPDILVGGTPCQAFSVAGMREGLSDPRGALTIKYVELANAVDHVRNARGDDETVVIWENVPGVLSSKDNAFGCFLGALVGESEELQPPGGKWKDAGCVYGPKRTAAWRILDAQYFGLAQRRRRVFVIASARAGFDPCEVLFEREGMRRDHPPRRGQGANVAGTLTNSLGKNSGIPAGNDCNPRNLIAGTLQAGGKAAGSATLQDAESGLLVAFGGSANCKQTDVSTALSAHPGGTRMDAETETFVVHGTQDPDVALGIAHTLGRNHGQENAVFDPNQITSVTNRSQPTPGLCHTLPASSQPPIAFSCKDYGADAGEVAPTLRAMGHGDSHANAGGQVAVQNTTGVRRLTPRECERLQGFPDDYTLIPWRGKPATECPDGPRYKAIGNSKAVPVVRWIGRRLKAHLEKLS
ncbi:DNA cytosine methyltransferase [Pseudomonas aeruginosa]|uniref:DNA cytosine methyltransferase n=1 Tax=Pseudomonas aeruginosa TaxID=287 RepID=UPI000FC405DF|nr:DNA (cytosine-5-)-methyltransferase [Pseudomonas aeruginosa]MDP1372825.1 DNA (cytosine-5-)-methyltransferase [Pseudomonas aeruginosa]RUA88662.1 DNA cytosine methyltransferase [Pseudomonas aeruginosa]HEJ2229583.1 DNA cytosine methyltransferase [Pseudomonas aeruginosa]HEJ3093606.1 DNA cytosine methyltransferase [Pseudomonas aeruginosa]HEK1613062.1 DNA cytosine methyltransferase [Pseudomonas aeruginosa]